MPSAHIVLKIAFDERHPEKTTIKTNARKEAIEEILEAWLSCQIGGKDKSKPKKKSVYQIEIQLDLSDDSFVTHSDTGNKGLTCGIIIDVFKRLKQLKVLALS